MPALVEPAQSRPAVWRMAGKPVLLLAGLVAAALFVGAFGQSNWIDRFVVGRGAAGAALFVLIGVVACGVGIPRQIVAFGAGYAFGVPLGFGLSMTAQILGCAATVAWSRAVGREWAERWMRGRRLARLDAFLSANPFLSTLCLRLLPVGSNFVLNLLAGASGVAFAKFLAASLIGYIPQTIVCLLLGSGVRVGEATQLAVAATLFVLSLGGGAILFRQRRLQEAVAEETFEPGPA